MMWHSARVIAALSLALAASLMVLAHGGPHGQEPVYSVAQVQAALARDPDRWAGRTVRVRGMAEPCPWWGGAARLWQCADEALILVADPTDPVAEPLPLRLAAPTALLGVPRVLPVLGALLPQPPGVPLFTPARFRVRLLALPMRTGGGYEALLLGVAPPARPGG